ncbi:hypothetical protein [Nonomuraea sp. NPDC001636]|uniref:hypothetical protein n=1 Tax=Actinomycetes TaxID=1760 RepID=UPI00331B010F
MTARTMAVRLARAQLRAEQRDTLLSLLARVDALTAAERAVVVEYVHAELTASDELRRTVQGQQRAYQAAVDRTRAADATIVEVEQERDAAQGRAEFFEAAQNRMRDRKEVAAVRVRRAVEDPACPDSIRRAVHSALDHQEQP